MSQSVCSRPQRRGTSLCGVLCALLLSCAPADVGAVMVGVGAAADQAEWHVRRTPLYCGLWHEIPDFGVLRFWHQAGDELQLGVQAVDRDAWSGPAELVVGGPPWRPQVPRTLGALEGRRADARVARAALAALDEGLALRVVVRHGPRTRHAEASPAHVRDALLSFRRCEAALHPNSFEQLERTIVRYGPSAGVSLDEAARARLDLLARYVAVDDSVRALYVDAHTDSVGKLADNMRLSRARAEAVAAYLESRGVPRERIVVRWHADRYPVASNEDAAGRARNRRTTVRLSREPPPVVARVAPQSAPARSESPAATDTGIPAAPSMAAPDSAAADASVSVPATAAVQ